MMPTRYVPTHGAVHADVEIAAAPERVFEALTDPEELAAWWGSDDTYRTRDWETDPRDGGEWSVRTTAPDGTEGSVHGEYLLVDPPRRIALTWRASWDDFAETTVHYELTPIEIDGEPGTRLTVTHTGFKGAARAEAGAACARGWERALVLLAAYVGGVVHFARRRAHATA